MASPPQPSPPEEGREKAPAWEHSGEHEPADIFSSSSSFSIGVFEDDDEEEGEDDGIAKCLALKGPTA